MSRTSALALADTLAKLDTRPAHFARFFDEIVASLARTPTLVELSLCAVSVEQATFTLPDSALHVLACFYDNRHLDHASVQAMNALHAHWRDAYGTPVTYVTEHEAERTFRLYPRPALPSAPFVPVFFDPFGHDYPLHGVAILHTVMTPDTPAWLDLPLALNVLTRTFALESPYTDTRFATHARALHTLFAALTEI